MPLTAGAAMMNYGVSTAYSIVGAVAWDAGLPLLGFGLGQFAVVQKLLEPVFILIALASLAPMFLEWRRQRRLATKMTEGLASSLHEVGNPGEGSVASDTPWLFLRSRCSTWLAATRE